MDQERLSKLAGIKEDWKDEEFSAKGREADEKSMQAAQDRYDARQNKPEINPGDSIVNSLDDIEKYYNKILSSLDPYDYNHKIDDWVMEIKDAVEKIRTRLNDLND